MVVLLSRCLSGELPSGHIKRDEVLRTKVRTPAPSLVSRCPEGVRPPQGLTDLVMSLLRIDPHERPESALWLARRLREILEVAHDAVRG